VAAVYEDWTRHGGAVLAKVRTNSPGRYLRVVASLVPRDVHVQTRPNDFAHLTDLQLVQLLQEQARSLLEERSEENTRWPKNANGRSRDGVSRSQGT
jgi:hypothetical protein